jgi:ribosomal protein L3 glutamine methyltransferase
MSTTDERPDERFNEHAALATLRDLIRFAVSRFNAAGLFFGHGSTSAWDEAVYLVLHTLHLPLDRLEPFLDARVTASERAAVLAIIDRRADERVPAAYLTGEAWLGDYRFVVDPRVIVPRSFIAEMLFERLAPWVVDPDGVARVMDLCTGSGCLAIIAADAFPDATVDAVDLSTDALAVARINVDDYDLAQRVRLIRSDVFAAVPHDRYDVIMSNPPYVNDASMDALPDEYLREPRMALAGGGDGLDVVRRILSQAKDRLTAEGVLIVEVGHERVHVEAAFPDLPLTWVTTSGGDDAVFAIAAGDLP